MALDMRTMCYVVLGLMVLALIECSLSLAVSAHSKRGVGVASLVFSSFQLAGIVTLAIIAGVGLARN